MKQQSQKAQESVQRSTGQKDLPNGQISEEFMTSFECGRIEAQGMVAEIINRRAKQSKLIRS